MAAELCLGVDGCLSSEICDVDADCVGVGLCVDADPVLFPNVTVCDKEDAQFPLKSFGALMVIMGGAGLWCIWVAARKARNVRSALVKRKAAKKKGAKSGNGTTEIQKRAEELLEKSREVRHTFDGQLEDVRKLTLREEMQQTLFMFQFLVLATMNLTHGDNKKEGSVFADDRKVFYVLAYLDQATTGIWYAMSSANPAQSSLVALQQSQKLLLQTAQYFELPCPFQQCATHDVLNARHDSDKWGARSAAMQQLEARVLAFKPAFAKRETKAGKAKTVSYLRRYKVFFFLLYTMCFTIFLAFAAKINSDNDALDKTGRLGGYGQTFLPVPPQYNLAASPNQAVAIPILYGLMHNALFFLAIVPLPMCRGLIRDLVKKAPAIRKYLPVDDLPGLHRFFAYNMFILLFSGATLWIIVMSIECRNNVVNACLAFTPAVNLFIDPIENVFMLRFLVICLWPFMAVIYFARDGAPWPLSKIAFFRNKWFEICYFSHTIIGHVTLTLALISRTEVFYPTLVGWSIYWIDLFRETVVYTKDAVLEDSQLFGRTKDGVPTSMRLKFKTATPFSMGAGQYVYIKVPSIDHVWHPYTLCSASNDDSAQVHVGIVQGKKAAWTKVPSGAYGATEWESTHKTWTYNLFKLVSQRGSAPLEAKLRGPYGCSFSDLFDPTFGGGVVIAAGTGLSAAESVLRESLEKRKAGIPGPSKLWMVFACKEEDSLIWCWERVISLLVKAVEDGVLNINTLTPNSNLFDWIGIQMYVTQSSPELLQEFTKLNQTNKVFGLRDSIFQRRTIQKPGKMMNAISRFSLASSATGTNSTHVANGNSDGFFADMEGRQAAPQQESLFSQPGLSAMRTAITSIAVGRYQGLDAEFLEQERLKQANGGNSGDNGSVRSTATGTSLSRDSIATRVREWVLSRVHAGSLDDEDTHIESFLTGVHEVLRNNGKNTSMAVGMCGPGALSLTVAEACRAVGHNTATKVSFIAETQ